MFSIEEIINTRARLVESAKRAMMSGYKAEEWASSPNVVEFATMYNLEKEIIHICEWVWRLREIRGE